MDDSSIASTSSNMTFSSTKIPPKRGTNRHLMGINDKSPPKTKTFLMFAGFDQAKNGTCFFLLKTKSLNTLPTPSQPKSMWSSTSKKADLPVVANFPRKPDDVM